MTSVCSGTNETRDLIASWLGENDRELAPRLADAMRVADEIAYEDECEWDGNLDAWSSGYSDYEIAGQSLVTIDGLGEGWYNAVVSIHGRHVHVQTDRETVLLPLGMGCGDLWHESYTFDPLEEGWPHLAAICREKDAPSESPYPTDHACHHM